MVLKMNKIYSDCILNGTVGAVATWSLTAANPVVGAAFGVGYTVIKAGLAKCLDCEKNHIALKILSWFVARPATAFVLTASVHSIAPAADAFVIGSILFGLFQQATRSRRLETT
jgi:hypothetical protein